MEGTAVVVIVSSGRSGTKMLADLLSAIPGTEVLHEYHCTTVQPIGVLYYQGLVTTEEAADVLRGLHGSAVRYTDATVWGDSSNKLSWLIEPLLEVFPDARFVHLLRDGRRVVSSFLHKLGDEIFDDRSTAILMDALESGRRDLYPPPDKKFWWTPPRLGTEDWVRFRSFTQFERICFQWAEVNRRILQGLELVPSDRQLTVRLEDLVARSGELDRLLLFLGLRPRPHLEARLARPVNVSIPRNFALSSEQRARLSELAGDMMTRFGYDRSEEYDVVY